jgi:hypothetical protein
MQVSARAAKRGTNYRPPMRCISSGYAPATIPVPRAGVSPKHLSSHLPIEKSFSHHILNNREEFLPSLFEQ